MNFDMNKLNGMEIKRVSVTEWRKNTAPYDKTCFEGILCKDIPVILEQSSEESAIIKVSSDYDEIDDPEDLIVEAKARSLLYYRKRFSGKGDASISKDSKVLRTLSSAFVSIYHHLYKANLFTEKIDRKRDLPQLLGDILLGYGDLDVFFMKELRNPVYSRFCKDNRRLKDDFITKEISKILKGAEIEPYRLLGRIHRIKQDLEQEKGDVALSKFKNKEDNLKKYSLDDFGTETFRFKEVTSRQWQKETVWHNGLKECFKKDSLWLHPDFEKNLDKIPIKFADDAVPFMKEHVTVLYLPNYGIKGFGMTEQDGYFQKIFWKFFAKTYYNIINAVAYCKEMNLYTDQGCVWRTDVPDNSCYDFIKENGDYSVGSYALRISFAYSLALFFKFLGEGESESLEHNIGKLKFLDGLINVADYWDFARYVYHQTAYENFNEDDEELANKALEQAKFWPWAPHRDTKGDFDAQDLWAIFEDLEKIMREDMFSTGTMDAVLGSTEEWEEDDEDDEGNVAEGTENSVKDKVASEPPKAIKEEPANTPESDKTDSVESDAVENKEEEVECAISDEEIEEIVNDEEFIDAVSGINEFVLNGGAKEGSKPRSKKQGPIATISAAIALLRIMLLRTPPHNVDWKEFFLKFLGLDNEAGKKKFVSLISIVLVVSYVIFSHAQLQGNMPIVLSVLSALFMAAIIISEWWGPLRWNFNRGRVAIFTIYFATVWYGCLNLIDPKVGIVWGMILCLIPYGVHIFWENVIGSIKGCYNWKSLLAIPLGNFLFPGFKSENMDEEGSRKTALKILKKHFYFDETDENAEKKFYEIVHDVAFKMLQYISFSGAQGAEKSKFTPYYGYFLGVALWAALTAATALTSMENKSIVVFAGPVIIAFGCILCEILRKFRDFLKKKIGAVPFYAGAIAGIVVSLVLFATFLMEEFFQGSEITVSALSGGTLWAIIWFMGFLTHRRKK